MARIDFPKLLTYFEDSPGFKSLIKLHELKPDEFIYELDTDRGTYYVYEIDFIDSLDQIKTAIKSATGIEPYFLSAKSILSWEDSGPVKISSYYTPPDDLEYVLPYLNDKAGSQPYYFTLLATHRDVLEA